MKKLKRYYIMLPFLLELFEGFFGHHKLCQLEFIAFVFISRRFKLLLEFITLNSCWGFFFLMGWEMPCFFSWVFGPSPTLFFSHIFSFWKMAKNKNKNTYSILLLLFLFSFLFFSSFLSSFVSLQEERMMICNL